MYEDFQEATMLWKASEQGHEESVYEVLQHHKIDPNKLQLIVTTQML